MKLARRIALITGAQQGIGAAIAVALAEEGADVTNTRRRKAPAPWYPMRHNVRLNPSAGRFVGKSAG